MKEILKNMKKTVAKSLRKIVYTLENEPGHINDDDLLYYMRILAKDVDVATQKSALALEVLANVDTKKDVKINSTVTSDVGDPSISQKYKQIRNDVDKLCTNIDGLHDIALEMFKKANKA